MHIIVHSAVYVVYIIIMNIDVAFRGVRHE